MKGRRVDALNRYFDSNQCGEILNTIKKRLKIKDNKILIIIHDYLKYINIKRDEFNLEFEKTIGEKEEIRKISR